MPSPPAFEHLKLRRRAVIHGPGRAVFCIRKRLLHGLLEQLLVRLDLQQVLASPLPNRRGNLRLATDGIDRNRAAAKVEKVASASSAPHTIAIRRMTTTERSGYRCPCRLRGS